MKQRIQLFGAIALLALIVGAFLLPSMPAHAATIVNYQRALPAEKLVDNMTPTTIATISFHTDRRGMISLTTLQRADLGAIASFSEWDTLSIRTNLDGTMIENSIISPSHGNPPLTQIGIRVKAFASPGWHTLLLVYISACGSSTTRPSLQDCHDGIDLTTGSLLYRGKLWLSAPGLRV